ncbi:MAG: transglycosylase SLT domain-containing protein [Anaerolineales bacterium]|nr:transglycosylase SLT domain-containing protein [Anaerolineales bacterium]
MWLGEKLVIPGAILGSVAVVACGLLLTAGTSLPPAPVETHSLEADVAVLEPAAVGVGAVGLDAAGQPVAAQVEEPCQVSRRYPRRVLQWCALITRYAEQYNVPPNLVAAVVWQESGGNPKAVSRSGAVGLMQVMPKDGIAASFTCVNGPCFANRPTSAQLKDPEFNLKYGVRMLSGLIKRHGDEREALRAYGPVQAGYSYADRVLSIYKRYGKP